MYELLIKGFHTKEQAQAFVDWYEGQGEQDAAIWFECCKEEGEIDVDWMPVDMHKNYKYNAEEKRLTIFLNIEKTNTDVG